MKNEREELVRGGKGEKLNEVLRPKQKNSHKLPGMSVMSSNGVTIATTTTIISPPLPEILL